VPLFSGKVNLTAPPDLIDKVKYGLRYIRFLPPDIDDNRVSVAAADIVKTVDRMFSGAPVLSDLADALNSRDANRVSAIIDSPGSKSRENRLRVVDDILAAIAGNPREAGNLILCPKWDQNLIKS